MTPTDLSPLRALETEWRETAAGLMALTEANAAQATSAELLVLWRLEARRTTECADALARCLDTLGETEPKGPYTVTVDRCQNGHTKYTSGCVSCVLLHRRQEDFQS